MRFAVMVLFIAGPTFAQTALQGQIRALNPDDDGKLPVACSLLGGRETYEASLCGVQQAPGQRAESTSALEDFARHRLQDANANGFIHVRDVSSGRVLLHVSATLEPDQDSGLAIDSRVLPLSIIKVYLAAVWLERGFGGTTVDCAASATKPLRRMLVADVLVSGCDSAAEQMATILRRQLGAPEVLRDLHQYGIEDLTLGGDASDADWGRVLSLGEDRVSVTPRQLSSFSCAIGEGDAKLFSERTARRLIWAE